MYSKRNQKQDGVTHLELIDTRGVCGEGERVTTQPFWIHLQIYEVVGKRSPQLEPFFFVCVCVKSHLERPPLLKPLYYAPGTHLYTSVHI